MIDKELEQNVVLVAEKPYGIHITQDAFVWWRINPLSGATVGVSDHGRGASLVEHLIKITIVGGICLISAVCWVLFGGPEAYERCIASGKDPGYCYASSMAGPAYKTFRILAFFATLLKFPLLMFPIWAATHVEHD
jgi:hypothetical protein